MSESLKKEVLQNKQPCRYHDYQEYIDPNSGGFVRCKNCGHEVDCEEDEDW